MRDPRTQAEWQEAVNVAAFLLLIHSAAVYGPWRSAITPSGRIKPAMRRCAKDIART
jgi:hypothetical protein